MCCKNAVFVASVVSLTPTAGPALGWGDVGCGEGFAIPLPARY